MSAVIVHLADYRLAKAARARPVPGEVAASGGAGPSADFVSSFQFWTGASGKRYVHSVYSLTECPELPAANYVLVRRDAGGRCHALAVGRLTSTAASANVAEIRQRGALLGATEVHVHLLAEGRRQMKDIERDLRSAQFPVSTWSVQH